MAIDIIEFHESFRDELRDLYDQVRKETFTWLDHDIITQSVFDRSTQGELILVAKSGSTCAGFVSAWPPDNYIHHLYIRKEFQQQGIGKLLFYAISKQLIYPITLKCLKKNVPAFHFYKQLGFIPASEGISNEGEYVLLKLEKRS